MTLYNQHDKKPTRKVQAFALGSGLASIGMGVWAIFDPATYALVPPGMEAGIATVLGFALGYFARERA